MITYSLRTMFAIWRYTVTPSLIGWAQPQNDPRSLDCILSSQIGVLGTDRTLSTSLNFKRVRNRPKFLSEWCDKDYRQWYRAIFHAEFSLVSDLIPTSVVKLFTKSPPPGCLRFLKGNPLTCLPTVYLQYCPHHAFCSEFPCFECDLRNLTESLSRSIYPFIHQIAIIRSAKWIQEPIFLYFIRVLENQYSNSTRVKCFSVFMVINLGKTSTCSTGPSPA